MAKGMHATAMAKVGMKLLNAGDLACVTLSKEGRPWNSNQKQTSKRIKKDQMSNQTEAIKRIKRQPNQVESRVGT